MNKREIEDNIKAGREIFESVPKSARPGWGMTLLQTFEKYLHEIPKPVFELYPIIEDEKRWGEAHSQFLEIRKFVLDHKSFEPESYLLLAEGVAKITYNESGLAAPFDHDSGWKLSLLAKQTATYFGDVELKNEIERVLTSNLKK